MTSGAVWTPLTPEFGSQVPMKRAGQPAEIAPSYVFLASEDASYMTGQVVHPNGGYIANGQSGVEAVPRVVVL